ncbi:MAG: LacI family DNA-binding transcriptional regulator [Candidatus Limnocylindrales bacterium]
MTISDVAEVAGVSKTAVSFAFNSPSRLGEATAVRIREVADELGYRPNPVARALTRRKTGSIGVLTPQALSVIFANPFFSAFSEGVGLAAEESGYGLNFISPLHGSLSDGVGQATVDGIVAIGLSADHPEVEGVRRAGMPIVTVDSSALAEYPSVEVDDEAGARAAAEHLLDLGHRDFLVIGVEPPLAAGRDDPDGVMSRRLRGYRSAIEAAGASLPEAAILVGPASVSGGTAAFAEAWADGLRPTAVLAMSDAMAVGAIRAMRDLRIDVPGDISVVGYDDLELARLTDPPLTTVHQPVRQKGEEAVRLLLSAIEGQPQRPERRRLETRLVVRASTAPPPTHRSQEVSQAFQP